MKYKLFFVLLTLLMFFAVGCTKKDAQQEEVDQGGEAVDPTISQSIPPLPEMKIEGDIKNIYYAHGNKVLISADKLYLYDVDSENIVAEAPQETVESEQFWVIDSGYVSVKESNHNDPGMMEGVPHYTGTFYNHELQIVSEFDFNQSVDEDDLLISLDGISFSKSGNKLAYATYSGLYTYDFEKDSKTKVIDLELEDSKARADIVVVEQVGIINEDTRIAFKAQTLSKVPEKPSYDTCGVVNVDGTELSNRTFDSLTCKQVTSYSDLLLLAEDPTIASGKLMVMETTNDKTKLHTLMNQEEGGNVTGSDGGQYFATSSSNKDGFTIRVYNTETGQLEGEQQVAADEKGLYLSHDPVIKLLDDTRTYIILLGSKRDDIETKMIINDF